MKHIIVVAVESVPASNASLQTEITSHQWIRLSQKRLDSLYDIVPTSRPSLSFSFHRRIAKQSVDREFFSLLFSNASWMSLEKSQIQSMIRPAWDMGNGKRSIPAAPGHVFTEPRLSRAQESQATCRESGMCRQGVRQDSSRR